MFRQCTKYRSINLSRSIAFGQTSIPLVLILNDSKVPELKSVDPISYDFRNADHDRIVEFLSAIDWDLVLDGRDVNNAALTLSHILGHVIERHVPKICHPAKSKLWMTRELRMLKTAKKSALRKYSKHHTVLLQEQYRKLNSAYNVSSRNSFRRYQQNLQRNLKANPKFFWQYVKSAEISRLP